MAVLLRVLGIMAIKAGLWWIAEFLAVWIVAAVMWFKGGTTKAIVIFLLIAKFVGLPAALAYFAFELMGGLDFFVSATDALATQIESVVNSLGGLPVVNRIFPVQLFLTMVSVLLTLRIIALGIRVVKALIPGLGSSTKKMQSTNTAQCPAVDLRYTPGMIQTRRLRPTGQGAEGES